MDGARVTGGLRENVEGVERDEVLSDAKRPMGFSEALIVHMFHL